jgi:4,5-dihydroxyphthalate decarboxylase
VVRKDLELAVSREVFRLLQESKDLGAKDAETSPFGIEANRRNLEIAVDYFYRQKLIPTRYTVDELFE